jgi:hypothetical protein
VARDKEGQGSFSFDLLKGEGNGNELIFLKFIMGVGGGRGFN